MAEGEAGEQDSCDPQADPPQAEAAQGEAGPGDQGQDEHGARGGRSVQESRDLKLVVEGDFYGANNGIRLRHAYGQYGLLLAGQTWTTFMDEDNIPNTIDFNAVVSPAWLGNDPGEALAPDRRFDYAAVNLRYWFIESRAWAGVEYLYGRKEVGSGEQGSANRVQLVDS